MTISIVDFDDVDIDDPSDAYWAVVERISAASTTYTNENAGPLRMASTLHLGLIESRDSAEQNHCWPQTG